MSEFIDAGKVLSIASSKTKAGVMYRIEVEDLDTGDTEWYGLGKEKPTYGEGSEISFEFEETDGGYLNIFGDSIEVLKEVKPRRGGSRGGRGSDDDDGGSSRGRGGSRGSSRSNGRSGGRSGSRSSRNNEEDDDSGKSRGRGGNRGKSTGGSGKSNVDWETKDKRIELMSARNSAIEVVKLGLEHGAITLPKTKGKAYDALEGFVNEQTARFLEQNELYIEEGIDSIRDGAEDGAEEE